MNSNYYYKITQPALVQVGPRRLEWRTRLQLSPQILPSAKTFTMTGLRAVKGYTSGLFSPHSGLYTNLSLFNRANKLKPIYGIHIRTQFSGFVDFSYGVDNLLTETLSDSFAEAGFSSAGLASNLQFNNNLFLSGQLAAPIKNFGYSLVGDNDLNDWQFYLSMKYRID